MKKQDAFSVLGEEYVSVAYPSKGNRLMLNCEGLWVPGEEELTELNTKQNPAQLLIS